jgi:putative oxidoreductase
MTDSNLSLYAALVLRVSLGAVFVAHALLKILVFTPAGTVAFFDTLGLPAFFAYAVIVLELAGGVALLLGFATRAVAVTLIPVLIGTIVLVHGDKGWLFANEGGGWEYPAFLVAASLVQALLGNGAWALGASRLVPGREPDPLP